MLRSRKHLSPFPVAAATPAALWTLRHIQSAAVRAWTPPQLPGNPQTCRTQLIGPELGAPQR